MEEDRKALLSSLMNDVEFKKSFSGIEAHHIEEVAKAAINCMEKYRKDNPQPHLPFITNIEELESQFPKKTPSGLLIGQTMYVKDTIKDCYAYLRGQEVKVLGQRLGSSYIKCEKLDDGEIIDIRENYLCDEPFDPLNPYKSYREQMILMDKMKRIVMRIETLLPKDKMFGTWEKKRKYWKALLEKSNTMKDLSEKMCELLDSIIWDNINEETNESWHIALNKISKEQEDIAAFYDLWQRICHDMRCFIEETRPRIPSPELCDPRLADVIIESLRETVQAGGAEALAHYPFAAVFGNNGWLYEEVRRKIMQEMNELRAKETSENETEHLSKKRKTNDEGCEIKEEDGENGEKEDATDTSSEYVDDVSTEISTDSQEQ